MNYVISDIHGCCAQYIEVLSVGKRGMADEKSSNPVFTKVYRKIEPSGMCTKMYIPYFILGSTRKGKEQVLWKL